MFLQKLKIKLFDSEYFGTNKKPATDIVLVIRKTNLMKKIILAILLFNFFIHFTFCSDDENITSINAKYVGTYIGNVDTYINDLNQ